MQIGPNLLVGHESSKFTVWRIEDGSSEADVNGGSGTSSLTTSNNSNSIAPVNGSPVPVNTTPIGSPGTGYSLAERARGLETPLRVYLIKEYSTNGPVLDINVSQEKSNLVEISRFNASFFPGSATKRAVTSWCETNGKMHRWRLPN